MNNKLRLLTVFCLLLSSMVAVAQDDDNSNRFNDYIINLKNDTIRCEVMYFKGPDTNFRLKYRITEGQRAKIMPVDSVIELFLSRDSSIYIPRLLPRIAKKTFLKRLEHGKVNLYQKVRSGPSYYVSTFWYAEKDHDSLKQIKIVLSTLLNPEVVGSRQEREKAFMGLIADNPDLLIRFKEARKSADCSFELIRYYIKTYNDEYAESHKTSK
ncbi:MAG: hypothetical protein JWP37_4278 [Mucilaginibacter sp.]|nr:hypothetical protein [Mucilaginibacter sp.]